jgi:hypothetical protein
MTRPLQLLVDAPKRDFVRPARKQRVALLEMPVLVGALPLGSGYLQTSAQTSDVVRDNYTFETESFPIGTAVDEDVIARLVELDADVYGVSCYVWNAQLARRVVAGVRKAKPECRIIMGGPQVMRHGDRYKDPQNENK